MDIGFPVLQSEASHLLCFFQRVRPGHSGQEAGAGCVLGIHTMPGPFPGSLHSCRVDGCGGLTATHAWRRRQSPGMTPGRKRLCKGPKPLANNGTWLGLSPFCSLPRCRAPSAAHRGAFPRRPEARDELRGRGCGIPPKCCQRPHLCLRVLVLRADGQHSQVCSPRPSHCCQGYALSLFVPPKTFLIFMYL